MFGLDPQSIAERVKASGPQPRVPTLGASLLRGTLGFTVVSLGGFAPWMLAGRSFYRAVGEVGMYSACAVVFLALSGLLLHPLLIGPGTLGRFYKVFVPAFGAYAVVWTVGWMALRGHAGSIVGLLAGTAAMGAIFTHAFAARGVTLKMILVLFAANAIGYFAGGWAHEAVLTVKDFNLLGFTLDKPALSMLSKAVWGLFYGLGFGAGIGFALYTCQTEARRLILG